jgi:outer membrane receptor protein involved in Fe transport
MIRRPSGAALVATAALLAGTGPGAAASPPAEDDSTAASVTETLQGQDGVRIQTMCTHCNSANIQVGGLAEDLVPVLRDGYPVLGGLATSVLLSVLPPDTIVDTQVAKGPGEPVAPAPAAGGVLRLTGASPLEVPRVDVAVDGGSYDLLGGHVRASGALGSKLQTTLTVGTTAADPVDDDGDGAVDVGALEREYVEGVLLWDVARDHTVDVGVSWIDEVTTEARGAYDVLGTLFSTDPDAGPSWTREDTALDRLELRAGWVWDLGRGRSLEVRGLGADRDQNVRSQLTADADGPLGPDAAALFDRFRIDERHRWGTIAYDHVLGFDWRVRFGVETHEHDVRAETLELFDLVGGGPAPDPEVGTDFVERRSAYAHADWTISPRWSLAAGLRWDDVDWGARELGITRSDDQVSPRASLRFAPATGWSIRALFGRTFRAPKPILAEVCCGQAYQRSTTARAESGTTVGVEGVVQPGPNLRVSVYAARTEFDDHLLRLVGWSQVYTQTYALANVPEARADTLEAAIRFRPAPRWTVDASAGWLSLHNRGGRDVAVLVTPPSRATPVEVLVPMDRIPYRPVRTGSLSLAWTAPRGVSVTASGNYTGPMRIQQFDQDPTAAQNVLLPDLRETDGFWLAGVSVRVPIHHQVDVVAAMDNLFDEIQSDLGDPTADYNWGPLSGRAWRLSVRWHLDR